MSASLFPPGPTGRRTVEIGPLLALFGLASCLVIGLAAGFPIVDYRVTAAAIVGLLAITSALVWPFAATQALFVSSIFLTAWVVVAERAANPIDLLMPPVLLASIAGTVRRNANREDERSHPRIRKATHDLTRDVIVFYVVAVLSLVVLGLRGAVDHALDSMLVLIRALQGLVFFSLGMWWMRTDRQIRIAERSLEAGIWILAFVNLFFVITMKIPRAGMTWILNSPDWPITSPNEAAISLLIVWGILISRPGRGLTQGIMVVLAPIMLTFTQSRSGLLAWTMFVLLGLRWWRWRTLIAVVTVVTLAVMLTPPNYWGRLTRTLSLGGGSFEAYSSIIRMYGWQAAVQVFLENPIFGVGYLGFRFVSSHYNDLRIVIGTAESYYLETAAGMGILGLVALARALRSLWRVGTAVRAVAPLGSHGHELARRHGPLVLALMTVNLTGDQFIGMTGLAQISLWTALVIRAGQMSVAGAAAGPDAVPASPAR